MTLGGSRGLSGLLRLSGCWGGSKKKTLSRKAPAIWTSAHVCKSAMCSRWAIATPLAHAPAKHCDRTPAPKYTPAFTSATHPTRPPTPPSSSPPPVCCFLKEKCERRKKRGKECSARGGRWRKPHFFRRAAASGLLRWL